MLYEIHLKHDKNGEKIENKLFLSLQKVSVWKKFYLIYSFFFVRKIIAHVVTFILYCVVIPATIFIPEVQVPRWGTIYIPTAITVLNILGSAR